MSLPSSEVPLNTVLFWLICGESELESSSRTFCLLTKEELLMEMTSDNSLKGTSSQVSPSGGLNENGPSQPPVLNTSQYWWNSLKNIRYGLVGGGISLDVGSGMYQVPPPFSALCLLRVDRWSSQVLLQHRTCLPAAMFPTITVINSSLHNCEPQIKLSSNWHGHSVLSRKYKSN